MSCVGRGTRVRADVPPTNAPHAPAGVQRRARPGKGTFLRTPALKARGYCPTCAPPPTVTKRRLSSLPTSPAPQHCAQLPHCAQVHAPVSEHIQAPNLQCRTIQHDACSSPRRRAARVLGTARRRCLASWGWRVTTRSTPCTRSRLRRTMALCSGPCGTSNVCKGTCCAPKKNSGYNILVPGTCGARSISNCQHDAFHTKHVFASHHQ